MKISTVNISNISDLPTLIQFLTPALTNIFNAINGNISVGDNLDGNLVSITFSGAGVDSSVAHGIGRTPLGYIITGCSAPMEVYDGSTASDATNLILRSSAAGTARFFVF